MFRVVLDERKRREIDPTVVMLEECLTEVAKEKEPDHYTERRLRELHRFFSTTTDWYLQVRQWPTGALVKFLNAAEKLRKALGPGA
jgi:DNA-binding transcriptional regulator GbsR (MarR family)